VVDNKGAFKDGGGSNPERVKVFLMTTGDRYQ